MTRHTVPPQQPAQVDAQSGMQANAANVVRVTGKPRCAVCGDRTRYDEITRTHEVVWCPACNPRPDFDELPF